MSLIEHISTQQALMYRSLVMITGDRDGCFKASAQLLAEVSLEGGAGLMSREAGALFHRQVAHGRPAQDRLELLSWSTSRALLGRSLTLLVIDLFDGLNPDALGATLGAVRGGGLVLLLGPAEAPADGALRAQLLVWPHPLHSLSTRYWERWWRQLKRQECLYRSSAQEVLDAGETIPAQLLRLASPRADERADRQPSADEALSVALQRCRTPGQRATLEVIRRAHEREAFTAVSVLAHRGRGKSYALGLAAATLLLEGEGELCVTAPKLEALESFFEAARWLLSAQGVTLSQLGGLLQSSRGVIRYVSPSVLWAREQPFRALFVDEAASLPVPLLMRLLEGRPKLIFSTTTYGYEGAGRGFSLRFRPHLQRKVKKLYELELEAPLRWAAGDPVERWSLSSLLLDASVSMARGHLALEGHEYTRWDRAALAGDEGVLRSIFGLLVSAHYRTQPSDAWRLLDAPNLSVHTLSDGGGVVAVALISVEGSLDAEMAAQLYEGRSRPRGQLFAANFSVHLNCEEAATLSMARVVRVAVRPQDQSKGLGRALIKRVEDWARSQGVELFGSSFGVTSPLLRFWLGLGFQPLRVSVRQSDMSGERSALVCKGLSARGEALLSGLSLELTRDFESQLRGPLRHLELEVVQRFLSACPRLPDPRPQLSRRDWLALSASAFAGRAFELAEQGARALALCAVSVDPLGGELEAQAQALELPLATWRVYLLKALQGHRWLEITRAERLDGPPVAMKAVSEAQRALLWRYAPGWLLEEARRFPRFKER